MVQAFRPLVHNACQRARKHRAGKLRLRYTFDATDKGAQIYEKTGHLRAIQLLLGHTKLESTVRYLGIEVDDALAISEQVEL